MRKYRKLFAFVLFFSFVSIYILLFYAGNEIDNHSTNVNEKVRFAINSVVFK